MTEHPNDPDSFLPKTLTWISGFVSAKNANMDVSESNFQLFVYDSIFVSEINMECPTISAIAMKK